jgi:multiple sugar transport system ATP-binding protein
LPARVEGLDFLGDSMLLHARHEPTGTALVLRLPPEAERPAPGALLQLTFDPSRALLFGSDGRRVSSTPADQQRERALA